MGVIENALIGQVRARVDADEQLDVGAGLLVLAALEGDAALDRALSEDAADRQPPSAQETGSVHTPARRAFLDTISVQGFRGIGAGCDLSIKPGPGLTLVVGRNGSGKSSFAEALELLLTGENRRWEGRSAVWRAGWRNLHWTGPAAVSATLAVEPTPTTSRPQYDTDWRSRAATPTSPRCTLEGVEAVQQRLFPLPIYEEVRHRLPIRVPIQDAGSA